MTGNFAETATRLAAVAARLLGWRPTDFWQATPAELAQSLTTPTDNGSPLSRSEIERMMERENG